jgi:uncharacterized membrane protein/glutaredoxin
MKDNNSAVVLYLVIKNLKIPVTRHSVIEEIQKYPDQFSLAAISDILDHWLIPNAAYNASVKEIIETEIPAPFIACFREGKFVMVNEINGDYAKISDEHGDNQQFDIAEFRKKYRGTILAFQKDSSSGETDYDRKRRREIGDDLRVPFIIAGLTTVFVLFLLSTPGALSIFKTHIISLFLFKSAGLAISVLLLMQSLDANNPVVKRICGSDENKNCNAILSSNAAKIADELSWSEVGFFYFAGTWLTLLLNSNNPALIEILAIMNVFALPYTVYSIYYQWRIAKQWCIFCCAVQAILWLEFFSNVSNLQGGLHLPGIQDSSKLLIGLFIPVIIWMFIKRLLMSSGELNLLKPELYRFKYNKDFFKNILEKEGRHQLVPEEDTIVMGNREADHVITIVSNPYCSACSDAHKILDELMDIRDDVKLQFVFLTRIYSKELDKKVLTHFMNLRSRYDDSGVKKALGEWYEQKTKSYDLWRLNHPVDDFNDDAEEIVKQKVWCKSVGITGTPTLFINGRKLPDPYKPEDIKYLL